MDIALELLKVPNAPQVKTAMLVGSTNGIVAASTDAGRGASIGLHGNKGKPVLPFTVHKVSERLQKHHVNGVEIVEHASGRFAVRVLPDSGA